MEETTNSAARLLSLINEAQIHPPNTEIRIVWGSVLGISPDNTSKILEAISKLISLLNIVKKDVIQIEGIDHNIYIKHIIKIEEAFSRTTIHDQWNRMNNYIDKLRISHYTQNLC